MYHGDSRQEDDAVNAAMAAVYRQLDDHDLDNDNSFDLEAGLRRLTGRLHREAGERLATTISLPGSEPSDAASDEVDDTGTSVRLANRVMVIAIDPAGRVLLFWHEDPTKGAHWAAPGGGLEAGEDFHSAACRELAEETGWADVPVAPGEVHHEQVQWPDHRGRLVRSLDRYFVGRVAVEQRPLTEASSVHADDGILRARWWTLAELDATDEAIYPSDLAGLVRSLVRS